MVVGQRLVAMRMVMRLGSILPQSMGMHMMGVMYMPMCVGVLAVLMAVCMVFCQMQPHAQCHQCTGGQELPGDGFRKNKQGHDSTHKRRG